MGFEPRMRGRRFGRPAARKKSARDRRERQEASVFYEEATPLDPSQIRSTAVNALMHLGSQRFALPPYSEHFQRWMKDVARLLSDFKSKLPEAVDQQYSESVEKTLSNLQVALGERAKSETSTSIKLADRQRRLAAYESELSKLDQHYKTLTHEARRQYEQSFASLRSEIGRLDGERLRILHAKPSLLQKLFRRSEVDLEETANALRSQKKALAERKEALKQDLDKHRAEYENKRKEIIDQLDILRGEFEESRDSKLDDALEIRKTACEDFRREVDEAVDRLLKHEDDRTAEGAT